MKKFKSKKPLNLLTRNQEKFCLEFIKSNNASDAFRKAYITHATPESVNQEASRLMAKVNIKSRIAELREKISSPYILTATEVLEDLSELGRHADKGSDRVKSLELVGKHHKLFVEAHQFQNPDGSPIQGQGSPVPIVVHVHPVSPAGVSISSGQEKAPDAKSGA